MAGCPPEDVLRAGDPAVEAHVVACSSCQEKRALLDLLEAEEPLEAKRDLDAALLSPERILEAALLRAGAGGLRLREPRQRWPMWAGIFSLAGAAVTVVVLIRPPGPPLLAGLQGETRPLEAAIAGAPYAPYAPARGAQDESRFDKPLRQLLEAREKGRPDADRALAMLFLLRGTAGDAARADESIRRAGEGPDALNDRGVIAYTRGDQIGALDLFDRVLRADPAHEAARFNRALALERLGLFARAIDVFGGAVQRGGRWAGEARDRAARLSSRPPRGAQPPVRREALVALLSAATAKDVAAAEQKLAGLPPGMVTDLQQLAKRLARLPDPALEEHGRLFQVYLELRGRVMGGKAEAQEVEEFSRLPRVTADPVLWAPALQLAAYVHEARGEFKSAERFVRSLASACRVRGCAVEHEAIALDEAADAAARDGDFASARKLQARAEGLFATVAAELQLAELHRKRAQLLDEERLTDEAARSAAQAIRELAELAGDATLDAARAGALAQAADVASHRQQRNAAAELFESAVELAGKAGARDLEVDSASALAENAAALGDLQDARTRLEAEVRVQEEARHASGIASLHAALADILLRQKDPHAALAAAERGLAVAREGAWSLTVTPRLHLAHARALRSMARPEEAAKELNDSLESALKGAATAKDPVAVLAPLEETASELAQILVEARMPADEVVLPLDRLRAALVGAKRAPPGWSRSLPLGACVVIAIPGAAATVTAVFARDFAKARTAEALDLSDVPGHCVGEAWWLAAAPLDRTDPLTLFAPGLAVGVGTSISRLLAPEPGASASVLLVSGAIPVGDVAGVAVQLPGAEREKGELERLGLAVEDLRGPSATPEAVLARAAALPLLHFAVHGFDGLEGGFLQLSGDPGRLTAADVTSRKLSGQRVVLAACETAAFGQRGLAFAFARSGAFGVVAARGRVDDAAAAAWSARFHALLAKGVPMIRAAHEAEADPRAPKFVVLK